MTFIHRDGMPGDSPAELVDDSPADLVDISALHVKRTLQSFIPTGKSDQNTLLSH